MQITQLEIAKGGTAVTLQARETRRIVQGVALPIPSIHANAELRCQDGVCTKQSAKLAGLRLELGNHHLVIGHNGHNAKSVTDTGMLLENG